MRQADLPPSSLLLDPNNYRFNDLDNYVEAAEDRFAEESVQSRTSARIRSEEGVQELKSSILSNGYIPVERIVVRPYAHKADTWVVVEGNRRTAAVKWILDDEEAGVSIPEEVKRSIQQLPVIIIEEDASEDEAFRSALMGIRHVSGIKQWGGYQRAKLVAHMIDDLHIPSADVPGKLGMSSLEVNRRYRAFKALEQMQNDEEYGDFATPSMYSMFHEAVSLPIVKEWLGWDNASLSFKNETTRPEFYELVSPHEDEEGKKIDPKITSYSQVRELRSILDKADAKRILLDPTRSFHEAVGIAKQDELSRLWISEVSEAISALESLGIKEVKGFGADSIALLERIKSLAEERLADYRTLTGQ